MAELSQRLNGSSNFKVKVWNRSNNMNEKASTTGIADERSYEGSFEQISGAAPERQAVTP